MEKFALGGKAECKTGDAYGWTPYVQQNTQSKEHSNRTLQFAVDALMH
jgi:hypothetical protein